MGEDCYYHTRDLPAEPFLVKLHDDVRIAAGVRLITHDIASYMVNKMPEYEQIGKAHYYMGTMPRTKKKVKSIVRKRSSQTEESCLGVTAIRLNASADKKLGKSRRKKSGQGCITRTCGG